MSRWGQRGARLLCTHARARARTHSKRGRKTRAGERGQHALSSRWSAQRAPPVPFLYTTAPGLHQPHQGLGRHSAQDVAASHCASSCAVIAVAAASAAAHLRSADIIVALSGSLAHCSEVSAGSRRRLCEHAHVALLCPSAGALLLPAGALGQHTQSDALVRQTTWSASRSLGPQVVRVVE